MLAVNSCLCPHCGYNLKAEEPVVDGRFAYAPRLGFHIDGERLDAPRRAHEILGALMLARGKVLSRDVLLARIGSEGTAGNTVAVYLCQVRNALRDAGVSIPFANVPRHGWRWIGTRAERQAYA